jgi:hypothetical protein
MLQEAALHKLMPLSLLNQEAQVFTICLVPKHNIWRHHSHHKSIMKKHIVSQTKKHSWCGMCNKDYYLWCGGVDHGIFYWQQTEVKYSVIIVFITLQNQSAPSQMTIKKYSMVHCSSHFVWCLLGAVAQWQFAGVGNFWQYCGMAIAGLGTLWHYCTYIWACCDSLWPQLFWWC